EGMVAFAGYPLLVEGQVVGVMAVFARRPLAEDTLEALATVADALAQGIERKRAEAALRASEEQHRLITDLTADFAYTARVEPDGRAVVEKATEGFVAVTGYTVAEVEGRGGWASLIHPDDLPGVAARGAGARDVHEARIVTKGGRVRWVRYSQQPL